MTDLAPVAPVALERDVESATWRIVAPAIAAIGDFLIPRLIALYSAPAGPTLAVLEARDVIPDTDTIEDLTARATAQGERQLDAASVRHLTERTAKRAAHAADVELGRQIKAQIGIDPLESRRRDPIRAKLAERSREHAALIKSIPERYARTIARRVREAVASGRDVAELERELREEIFGTDADAKARRLVHNVTRDQVTKLTAAHTEIRQVELGIEFYIWNTQEDERVRGNPGGIYPNARPSHHALNKTRQRWDTPPPPGHPGEAPLCRCYPTPYIPPALAEAMREEMEKRGKPDPIVRRPPPDKRREAAQNAREREEEAQRVSAARARASALRNVDPTVRRSQEAQRKRNEAANRRDVERFQRLREHMLRSSRK